MLRYLAVFVSVVLFGCATQTINLRSTSSHAEERLSSVAALLSEDNTPYCSGVFVTSDMYWDHVIVTAAHCVENTEPEVRIGVIDDFNKVDMDYDQTFTYAVELVWYEEDVAILTPTNVTPVFTTVNVSFNDVSIGDEVMLLGNPFWFSFYFSEGRVVAPLRSMINSSREFTLVNAPAMPGMSGGPALDLNGDLVGITSFGWAGQRNMVGIVPRGDVEHALRYVGALH